MPEKKYPMDRDNFNPIKAVLIAKDPKVRVAHLRHSLIEASAVVARQRDQLDNFRTTILHIREIVAPR